MENLYAYFIDFQELATKEVFVHKFEAIQNIDSFFDKTRELIHQ